MHDMAAMVRAEFEKGDLRTTKNADLRMTRTMAEESDRG